MRPDEPSENNALRHQLEGGLEVLEAAASRYRELTATLLAGGWKRRLKRAPTLVADTLAQEPLLPEVLARLEQRAAREPERSGPASQFLRQFEEERTKLWRAMGRRLSLNEGTLSLSGGTLSERLTQLQDRVNPPKPLPTMARDGVSPPKSLPPVPRPLLPRADEPVRLEGNGLWQPLLSALILLSPWLLLAFIGLAGADNPPPLGWPIVAGVSVATWAFLHARSGRYWLTSERLIWKPRWGEPMELPLSQIGEGDVSVNSWGTVKVNSLGGFALRHVPHASTLAALLSIRRRKEFQDATAVRDSGRLLAIMKGSSTRPGEPPDPEGAERWTAVLRPGFVAFFSSDIDGALLLDVLTEPTEPPPTSTSPFRLAPRSRDGVTISIDLFLEQIQLLPEERMDAMLRKAVSAYAGAKSWTLPAFLWEVDELKWAVRGGSTLELSRLDKAVQAEIPWAETLVVERLFERWMRPQPLPEPVSD